MKGLLNSGEIYGIFRVMAPKIVLVKVLTILFTEEDMRFSKSYHFLGVTSNFERPRVTSISDATYFLKNLMKSKSDISPKIKRDTERPFGDISCETVCHA